MSTHEFIVSVDVDDWPQDGSAAERSPAEYAGTALYLAELSETKRLDGYADLDASAMITSVQPL